MILDLLLLLCWTLALLVLPGVFLVFRLHSQTSLLSWPEVVALSIAYGAGLLTLEGIGLRLLGVLNGKGLAATTIALTLTLALAGRLQGLRRAKLRSGGHPAVIVIVVFVAGALSVLVPFHGGVFGADSYFWAGAATQIGQGPPDEHNEGSIWRAYPILHSSPTGYGYLLATLAVWGVALDGGTAMLFLSALWSIFSLLAAFALVERLAGPRWAAVGAMLYVSSYWSLYHLLHSITRQSFGLGLAPLFYLLLLQGGERLPRSPSFYALTAVGALLHAFTTFIVLCALAPAILARALSLRAHELWRAWRWWGIFGSFLVFAVPLFIVCRFLFAATGIAPFEDDPQYYRMESMNALELTKTLGGATVLTLAVAWHGAARRRSSSPRLVFQASLALFVFLVLVGIFHQEWYRSSLAALPPYRYYTFYSLVAILWLGLALSDCEKRFAFFRRAHVWAVIGLLVASQAALDAYFVRRMLAGSSSLQPFLDACRWTEQRLPGQGTVAVIASRRSTVASLVEGVLAPREVVWVDAGSELPFERARGTGAHYLITDLRLPETLVELARFDVSALAEAPVVKVARLPPQGSRLPPARCFAASAHL